MPYTAAEKQKRYKQKLRFDSEKYEEYKKKKRDNYHKKKRLLKDLSAKEKYNARVIWRLRKKQLRQRQKNLNGVLNITPPQNYTCKLHEEIQAHHFGGSKQQVSLHTVVVYLNIGNNKKVESYCTVSSNTNHQPAALWAHMDPILKDIRNNHPSIATIHFFSDGPFSQYRQKQNFNLSSTMLFDYGFTGMTWSFFEAGHGKGPADGIGGYLKRSTDDLVAHGYDIACANDFYDALKDINKTRLYLISSDDISNVAKTLPNKFQLLWAQKMYTRYLRQLEEK